MEMFIGSDMFVILAAVNVVVGCVAVALYRTLHVDGAISSGNDHFDLCAHSALSPASFKRGLHPLFAGSSTASGAVIAAGRCDA